MDDVMVGQEMYYAAQVAPSAITSTEDYERYISKVTVIAKTTNSRYLSGKIKTIIKMTVMNKGTKGTWVIKKENQDRLWTTKADAYRRLLLDIDKFIIDHRKMISDLRTVGGNLRGCITRELSTPHNEFTLP